MKSGMLCPGSVQVPLPQGHPKTPGYTIFQDTSDNWTWKTYWEQKRVTVHGGNCTRRGDWGWRGQSNFQGAWQHLRSFKNSNGCLALIRRKSERGLCFRHVVGAPKRCCLTIKQKHPKPLPPVINITYHTYDIMVSIFLLVVFFFGFLFVWCFSWTQEGWATSVQARWVLGMFLLYCETNIKTSWIFRYLWCLWYIYDVSMWHIHNMFSFIT